MYAKMSERKQCWRKKEVLLKINDMKNFRKPANR